MIEIIDEAPPPSDQEKALAVAWSKRMAALAQQLESLGNALRATAKLRQVVTVTGTATPEQRAQIDKMAADWEKLARDLFTSSGDPVSSVDPQPYRGQPPEPQPFYALAA